MGFFRRRRERESAIPSSTLEGGSIKTAPEPAPVATAESAPPANPAPPGARRPARPTPPAGRRSIADEVAAAAGGDLATQIQQLESLMTQYKVDLRSRPTEVREAVVADLNAGGVPAKVGEPIQFTEPVQVQTVVSVLKKHELLPENVSVDAG